jgi:hypothetical protein
MMRAAEQERACLYAPFLFNGVHMGIYWLLELSIASKEIC